MANPTATARSISGLIHALSDEQLLVLTATENRPALKVFLKTLMPIAWLTAKVGTRKNAAYYLDAIKASGAEVTNWAKGIMSQPTFTVNPDVCEVKYGCMSPRQFGFKKSPTLEKFIERLKSRGYSRCLPEDGPVICENYHDQPNGTSVTLAMDALPSLNGGPNVFRIYRDGGRYLDGTPAQPGCVIELDDEMVFRLA